MARLGYPARPARPVPMVLTYFFTSMNCLSRAILWSTWLEVTVVTVAREAMAAMAIQAQDFVREVMAAMAEQGLQEEGVAREAASRSLQYMGLTCGTRWVKKSSLGPM